MAATDTSELLRFRGPARMLEAVVPIADRSRSIPVQVAVERRKEDGKQRTAVAAPLAFARVISPGVVLVKLKFDRFAPAGTYEGTLRIGEQKYNFVAEVEPNAYLRATPPFLALRGASNGEAFAEITVTNGGNRAYEVEPVYAFGVFQIGGAEEALGKAYREQGTDDRSWIDRVGDHLAEAHGGLVRVQVTEGAGALTPGTVRTLKLHFRLPGNLRPGHSYDGKIEMANLIYVIRIDVPGPANT